MRDAADGRAAGAAGLAFAAINRRFQLKVARVAVNGGKVAQGAAALLHGARQHLADGGMQAVSARA